MLDQLVQLREGIEARGIAIAVVLQAVPEAAKAFAERRAPGLLCLSDPERKAYAAYGLGRGTLRQTLLSPKVWSANARAARTKGYKTELPPPGQDSMMMSGTFIIGTDGLVRLPYYYDHIADHADAGLLLSGLLSTDWDRPFDGPFGPRSPTSGGVEDANKAKEERAKNEK
jgi:peroxiredoxin